MQLRPHAAALLIVDAQRAFCAEDGSVARQGRDVSACADAIRACQDVASLWRGWGRPIIWTRMGFADDYTDGGVLVHELRPGIAEVGGLRWSTPDVDLIPTPAPGDVIIDKPRFSAFVNTALAEGLAGAAITDLVVTGVTTSMCVESTVRDASQRDLRVFVPTECVADLDPQVHAASLDRMAYGFARVASADELLAQVEPLPEQTGATP
jgi:nicotinamidase-related amidase